MSDATDRPTDDQSAAAGAAAAARDVSQIRTGDWEKRKWPKSVGGREAGFQVLVRQSALNTLHKHGKSQPEIEVCGVLVGNVYHDAQGPWLYVQHAIEGTLATGRAAQVTFTAETWEHIQSVMDRDHPNQRILGWYHTHPGFGIFLSDMDLFIQENFFPEPWQVALVYDPKAGEEGLFLWKGGKPEPTVFVIEEDAKAEEVTTIVKTAKEVTSKPAAAGEMVGEVTQFAQRLEAIEKRQKTILVLLAVIGLIALAWPLVVTAFLPDFLQQKESHPPIHLPSDDPTSRPLKL
jgi:proteasome lid subunit RPN8/RPN11